MQYFDIILFAVIAGVLAVRLYRILGTKSKVTIEESEEAVQKVVNIKKEKEPTKESIITENGEGLNYLKKVQPDFDEIGFLSGASKAFPMLLEAKYKANKKVLISFLEDDIFRIFDSLNDINNIRSSIKYVNKAKKNSQGTICYTTSPIHNEDYWIKLAKDIEDCGAKSLAIKDMAGLLRPGVCYDLVKRLKKNIKIPIHLHTHSTTGLSDATNYKAYEAGVDNIDTSISSFSNLYAHTATESFMSMIYDDNSNPYDMNLLSKISAYFQSIRPKYTQYEGSMRGVDIDMLINQVPGGMLSILEKQLTDLKKSSKLKMLINEIPKIREDIGYVPLVTPSSQIVGAQALMNVLDNKRYKTLNKEFVDLVNGKYGKIPGKVCAKLQKKVDKSNATNSDTDNKLKIQDYKDEFSNFCRSNDLKDYSNNETDLLNYILFKKESMDFYAAKDRTTTNEVIGLQEGFGLYIND